MGRRTIALCGIDGAGKSTLAASLVRAGPLAGARLAAKPSRVHARAVARGMLDRPVPTDYLTGEFARNLRLAHALDFLTAAQAENAHWPTGDTPVILDRWKLCYLAWAHCCDGAFEAVEAMLEPVPSPDLVLVVDVPAFVASERLRADATRTNAEHPIVLEAFRRSYLELVPVQTAQTIVIDGTRTARQLARTVNAILEDLGW